MEKGQIGKETLDKLAELLEVDAGWLLNGKKTKFNQLQHARIYG